MVGLDLILGGNRTTSLGPSMLALGPQRPSLTSPAGGLLSWILFTGFWNDAAVWNDNAAWKDGI